MVSVMVCILYTAASTQDPHEPFMYSKPIQSAAFPAPASKTAHLATSCTSLKPVPTKPAVKEQSCSNRSAIALEPKELTTIVEGAKLTIRMVKVHSCPDTAIHQTPFSVRLGPPHAQPLVILHGMAHMLPSLVGDQVLLQFVIEAGVGV